jgi:hypothetical protein
LISATGNISSVGNISAAYFLGNGSQLTGIALGASSNITNGTSNVTAALNGNVTVGIGGTTISTFASTGLYLPGVVSAAGNITGGNILGGTTVNATNLTGTLVSATGNVIGGNILTGGLISATGNITGGNLSGTSIVGTLTTASQTNITSVGTL